MNFGFCGVHLGNKGLRWHKQRGKRAVEPPKGNRTFVPQGRSEHITPADGCGLADLVASKRPEEEARMPLSIAAPLAAAKQTLGRRDAVAAKQIIPSPTLEFAVRVEGAMHGCLAGLITDGITILPLAASQFWEEGAEARHPCTLGVKLGNSNGKIEPGEDASGVPGLFATLLH